MLVTNFRIKYLIYRLVGAVFQIFDVGRVHPVRQRSLRALEDSVDYIEANLPDALGFETQKEVVEYALSQVRVEGHYLEFGVFTGGTTRFIAQRIGQRDLFGFDSFEGLPEDWAGFQLQKATFNTAKRLPRVPRNVMLYPGWFHEILPVWCQEHAGPIAFMHVDCDLYSSTKTIFDALGDRLQAGTIILFDEYFNYVNWRNHEYKAFQEFVAAHGITYRYLAYARQQVAVRIESTQAVR
jgi:hypothetical protein